MVNQQLIDYVKQELAKGNSPEKISADLLAQGWKKIDIDYAFDELNMEKSDSQTSGPSQLPEKGQPQQYYEAMIPVEKKGSKGMVEGIISVTCAVISLIFLPIIFGPVGIVLGVLARKKGQKTLGLVGIILSSIFLALGVIFMVLIILTKYH